MKTHAIVQKLLASPKFFGRDFMIENLPKLFLKKPKGTLVVRTFFGFSIKINPVFDKNIENVIYERGVYEQGTVAVVQSILKPGFHFVDVGANIGFLTLLAAKLVGQEGKVTAFEPVPSTFQLLEENIALNGFDNVNVHPFALGNEEKSVEIYSENENRGGASIVNHQSNLGEEIEVKRLDGVLANQKIDCIKIDVEGYELEVLQGAEILIRNFRPVLIVEHSINRTNTAVEFEIFNWIRSLALYDIFKLKHGKERKSGLILIENPKDLPMHDNIFCFPRVSN